jgi:SAM-dependent methyltransferase
VSEPAPDVWALGDYQRVAERLFEVAEVAVEAAGVTPGQHVLDVAAGTGNVAMVAARRGAMVTATDSSAGMVALGQARTQGLEVSWSTADAQELPFDDGSFDAAVSVFGAMFAPDQPRAAAELLRVVRPGGPAAMTAWVPEGPQADAMAVVTRQFPDRPPMMNDWGDPDIARRHFEAAGATEVTIERRATQWEFAGKQAWLDFVEGGPGPMVAAQRQLGDRWPQVREEMLAQLPQGDGAFVIQSPYLVIVARR